MNPYFSFSRLKIAKNLSLALALAICFTPLQPIFAAPKSQASVQKRAPWKQAICKRWANIKKYIKKNPEQIASTVLLCAVFAGKILYPKILQGFNVSADPNNFPPNTNQRINNRQNQRFHHWHNNPGNNNQTNPAFHIRINGIDFNFGGGVFHFPAAPAIPPIPAPMPPIPPMPAFVGFGFAPVPAPVFPPAAPAAPNPIPNIVNALFNRITNDQDFAFWRQNPMNFAREFHNPNGIVRNDVYRQAQFYRNVTQAQFRDAQARINNFTMAMRRTGIPQDVRRHIALPELREDIATVGFYLLRNNPDRIALMPAEIRNVMIQAMTRRHAQNIQVMTDDLANALPHIDMQGMIPTNNYHVPNEEQIHQRMIERVDGLLIAAALRNNQAPHGPE